MISPLSNGSLMLLATMAKRAGLPWDFIFSSDMHRAFKRDPAVYQNAIRLLHLEPEQIMMAAAHNDDLEAARNEGMQTAYINRPTEYGIDQKADFAATSDWNIIANSVEDLADQLACPAIWGRYPGGQGHGLPPYHSPIAVTATPAVPLVKNLPRAQNRSSQIAEQMPVQ